MHLVVFNDPHGFIMNLAVERLVSGSRPRRHIFINLTTKTLYKNDKSKYLDRNVHAFRRAIRELPPVEMISFCPLDYTGAVFLQEFWKSFPSVPVNWLFWSYEFYHRSNMYSDNLGAFSLQYFQKKGALATSARSLIKKILKKVLGIPVFNAATLDTACRKVSAFYSFLPADHKNVFSSYNGDAPAYHPISYISIDEITKGIPRDQPILDSQVMIGHSASLSNNHAEVIGRLAAMTIPNRFFIPLEYGDKEYGEKIKKMAIDQLGSERIEFQETRLDMQAYYQRLSVIGYGVFNFRWQEALGNILFLVWNGAKVFLRSNSSVYQQFSEWGFRIFSIETELNEESLAQLLPRDTAVENRRLIENLFSEEKVQAYWDALM